MPVPEGKEQGHTKNKESRKRTGAGSCGRHCAGVQCKVCKQGGCVVLPLLVLKGELDYGEGTCTYARGCAPVSSYCDAMALKSE